MSGRIRGHYRIDPAGHVMPLADVNAGMKPYAVPLPLLRDKQAEQKSRIIKMSMAGLVLFSLGVALMSVLPQIERSIVAAQATKMASVRSAFYRTHPEFHWHQHWHEHLAEN